MSENNETPAEKTSFLTTAMLIAQKKLTRETVPAEDANTPKKTLKPTVAFAAGVLGTAASLYAFVKMNAAKVQEDDFSNEDSENNV